MRCKTVRGAFPARNPLILTRRQDLGKPGELTGHGFDGINLYFSLNGT
jgi:hypothetical protein